MQNIKIPVNLRDGCVVESVYYGSGTLCISTQVGCSVGCPFCLSGSKGLSRNLTSHEMIQQIIAAREKGLNVARVTLSGIGEPLHNWENILLLFDYFRTERIPFSITSVGSPLKNLVRLLSMSHNGLMLSLHAGTERVHRRLIPGGAKFTALWGEFSKALDRMSRRRRRKIGINYLLIKGINDSIFELDNLLRLLEPHPDLTLHLLRCNSSNVSHFNSPSVPEFNLAYRYLKSAFPNVRRNNQWRIQNYGGCGTLLAFRNREYPI